MRIHPIQQTDSHPAQQISNSTALWGGILFSFAFTLLIWFVQPWITVDLLPDAGGAWYYWKLPEPTVWSRATSWGGYMLHQVTLWGLIYYAQTRKLRYTNKLHKVNVWALGANAFFILLHLFQSLIWYDGLAQDTSIFSSQGSVILMLVMILLMENQRRGLFFGKKIKALNPSASVARHYHGYIFAWAIVYTFWYHPMEATGGHLMGFFYMFLLMLQGSLFFTRIHVNKWWTFMQEFLVLVHGTMVAVVNGQSGQQPLNLWAMFFFGFAALVVVTQMYGLGLPRWLRWVIMVAFIGGVLYFYNGRWSDMNEVIRIPVIEYLSVFVLALIIGLGLWVKKLLTKVF